MSKASTQQPHVSLADLSDPELVNVLIDGNARAMEVLYDRYSRVVFSFALRMVGDQSRAEDLLQEVFLRAWRQIGRYQDGRGTFVTWILSITHNMAIDDVRKHQRRPKKADAIDPMEYLGTVQDGSKPVDEQAVMNQTRMSIIEAMGCLPANQRTVIELAYFKGYSQREIAETLEEPLGTIKTRARLAMARLRDQLEQELGD